MSTTDDRDDELVDRTVWGIERLDEHSSDDCDPHWVHQRGHLYWHRAHAEAEVARRNQRLIEFRNHQRRQSHDFSVERYRQLRYLYEGGFIDRIEVPAEPDAFRPVTELDPWSERYRVVELEFTDRSATTADPAPDLRSLVMRHLDRTAQHDTVERLRERVRLTFALFYDDEEGEPDQAIRDVLTDMFHEAHHRDVDIDDCFDRAYTMYAQERSEWNPHDTPTTTTATEETP